MFILRIIKRIPLQKQELYYDEINQVLYSEKCNGYCMIYEYNENNRLINYKFYKNN